jgi:hypothetical protein
MHFIVFTPLPALFTKQVFVFALDILHLLGVWMMERVITRTFSAAALAVPPDDCKRKVARNKACARLLYDHQRKAILTPVH